MSSKLNTSVFSIVPNTKGWYVEYKDHSKELSHTEKFDFVVLCTGMNSKFAKNDKSMTSSNSKNNTTNSSSENDAALLNEAEIEPEAISFGTDLTKSNDFFDESLNLGFCFSI